MLKVTVESDTMSFMVKDKDAESSEDCINLMSIVINQMFNEGIELYTYEPEDGSIYIEQDQPKDHIEHEGM